MIGLREGGPQCPSELCGRGRWTPVAYLGFSKGGRTRGSRGLPSPSGSGVEPQRPATFWDSEAHFEAL